MLSSRRILADARHEGAHERASACCRPTCRPAEMRDLMKQDSDAQRRTDSLHRDDPRVRRKMLMKADASKSGTHAEIRRFLFRADGRRDRRLRRLDQVRRPRARVPAEVRLPRHDRADQHQGEDAARRRRRIRRSRTRPQPVDVAIMAVPVRARASKPYASAPQAGVKGCVLITAGFAEMGEEGARRQAAVVAAAREPRHAPARPQLPGLRQSARAHRDVLDACRCRRSTRIAARRRSASSASRAR